MAATKRTRKRNNSAAKIRKYARFRSKWVVAFLVFAVIVFGFIIYRTFAAPQVKFTAQQRFGMTIKGVPWLTDAQRTQQMDQAKAAGAKILKFDLLWSNVQAGGPRSFNWSDFDVVVNEAYSRGFIIVADIVYSPKWAIPTSAQSLSNKSDWEKYAPVNPTDYANFAKLAASHYKGKVNHFEIWNEANNIEFFRPKLDVVKYVSMLKQSYDGIKSVNPDAVVITSGLSPDGEVGFTEPDGSRVNPVTFLIQMYYSGAKGYFDAVGWHPYNWGSGCPSQKVPWNAWYQMYGTNPSARSIMKQMGDEDKKIWVTEWAYPSAGTSLANEDWQAKCMLEGYNFALANPWLGPVIWFPFKDDGGGGDVIEKYAGLLRSDGSRKPAYNSYRNLSTSVQNDTPK